MLSKKLTDYLSNIKSQRPTLDFIMFETTLNEHSNENKEN